MEITVAVFCALWYTILLGGDSMSVSEAHKRASEKWNKSRDTIVIRPDKETGAAIRAAAAAAGLSIQQFILSAVAAFMEKK